MNACFKRLKIFLILRVKNIGSPIASKYIEISDFSFFDFLDLDESTTVSLALSPLSTTLLFLTLDAFGVDNPDDPIVFTEYWDK